MKPAAFLKLFFLEESVERGEERRRRAVCVCVWLEFWWVVWVWPMGPVFLLVDEEVGRCVREVSFWLLPTIFVISGAT